MCNQKKLLQNKFLIFFILISTAICQNYDLKVDLKSIPKNNSWFLNTNNFGIENEKFDGRLFFLMNYKDFELKINSIITQNQFLESYFKYSFSKKTNIKLGKYYKDYSGYLNNELSSGHMLISNNAMPMKKIGLNHSYLVKNFKFDFGISHGFFDKNSLYQKAPYLHEKYIFMGISRQHDFIGIGFIHEAMWAGKINNLKAFPLGFQNFLKVLIAADEPIREGQPHANAIGNHIGVWEFVYKKNLLKNNLTFYYQHIFEDTSGIRFANKYDGLWGLEIVNSESKNIFLLEYLETTNQNIDPPYVEESYYNHWDYPYGWSFKGNVIGNPHINSLNVVPVSVVHLGSIVNINQILSGKFLLSRKINKQDDLNFLINLSRKFNDNLSAGILLFSESGNVGIGLETSWKLK